MQRFKIVHRTYYRFQGAVTLGPHALRLRPREDHELRIESSALHITPAATLHWQRDVEGNSVAVATFETPTEHLAVESELIIQQYNEAPLGFLVADYAVDHPFQYPPDDQVLLAPYRAAADVETETRLDAWIGEFWRPDEPIQTYGLLNRLTTHIHRSLRYQVREEPGVQSALQTLSLGTGSCRDFAALFMMAVRHLGLAARFVSGYLHTPPSLTDFGATHAWAEVYLPGAGWKGFDPTSGEIVGTDHFPVAVARLPESVPPIAGSFVGLPGAEMDVGVWVTRCPDG